MWMVNFLFCLKSLSGLIDVSFQLWKNFGLFWEHSKIVPFLWKNITFSLKIRFSAQAFHFWFTNQISYILTHTKHYFIWRNKFEDLSQIVDPSCEILSSIPRWPFGHQSNHIDYSEKMSLIIRMIWLKISNDKLLVEWA